MLPFKNDIFIVAHKKNDLLNDFDHKIIDNVGLEFGAYDWYIKNKWDKKSNILLMHDDISINNSNVINNIFIKCKDLDQSYIFNNLDECERNGWKHGRCIYLSPKMTKWLLSNHNGIWYDKDNKGYVEGKKPADCQYYNAGIRKFHKTIKKIKEHGFDRRSIFNEDIVLYRRGRIEK